MAISETDAPSLRGIHVLEYPYRRSLGPVLTRFFSSLRERRIEGVRTPSGRVLVPPEEYDPETASALSDFVEVGPEGRVETWCWVARPRPGQPLEHPFAFALIRLDGADTGLLHAVDAGAPERMRTGLRVRPRWAAEPSGGIGDIECFEPAGGGEG